MFKDSSDLEFFEQKGTANKKALFDTVKHLWILGVSPLKSEKHFSKHAF